MENTGNERSLFDLSFDNHIKSHLRAAAKVAGVAALLSIISAGVELISFMIRLGKPASSRYESMSYSSSAVNEDSLAGVVIKLALSIFLFYFLNKFSKTTKTGLDGNNSQLINEGLGSLASYFRLIGIVLIVCIVLILLGVLIGIGANA